MTTRHEVRVAQGSGVAQGSRVAQGSGVAQGPDRVRARRQLDSSGDGVPDYTRAATRAAGRMTRMRRIATTTSETLRRVTATIGPTRSSVGRTRVARARDARSGGKVD